MNTPKISACEQELAEIVHYVLAGDAPRTLFALSIGVDHDARWLRIRAHFDGPPSADDIEAIQVAGTEVIAQWTMEDWKIDEDWEVVSPGEAPSLLSGGIGFRRGDPAPPPVVRQNQ